MLEIAAYATVLGPFTIPLATRIRGSRTHMLGERGISVLNVQATSTVNVQDKVSDWELPMILDCESEFSRIRSFPIEYMYALEIPVPRPNKNGR